METETESDDYESILYDSLRDRAPYEDTAPAREPTGGVLVHRCHPMGEQEDFFAFGMHHVTMKGYEERNVFCYTEDGEREMNVVASRWDKAVSSYQIREGSHEHCDVCQGESSKGEMIQELMDEIDGSSVVESKNNSIYFDYQSDSLSSDMYCIRRIEDHPYVHVEHIGVTGEDDRPYTPNNTVYITLGSNYNDREVLV